MEPSQQSREPARAPSRACGRQEGASATPVPPAGQEADSAPHPLADLWEPYRIVTESLSDAVYLVDMPWQIIFCNPALARLLPLTPFGQSVEYSAYRCHKGR